MSAPRVSVMVVTYNQAHLIGATLDSILADDYPNVEIVVSDDASTDGTQDILRGYAERFPDRFVLHFNPVNVGITRNSNEALFRCTGDLIALFAGDDLFLPGKLRAQTPAFDDPSVVLAYHSVEVFDSDTDRVIEITSRGRNDIRSAADMIAHLGIPGSCSLMIRRSAIPPGGYDVRIPIASDWLFWTEVALRGRIVRIDGVWARYRKHSNNIGRQVARYVDDFLQTLDILEDRYGADPVMRRACHLGRARFAAGEGFRRLARAPEEARPWFDLAVKNAPGDVRYRIARATASMPLLHQALLAARPFLRRWIA